MGKRRTSDIRAKRGAGFLIEAIKSGRIIDGDEDGAANVLAECIPGVGRQTRHAQLLLARNCMASLPDHILPPQLDTVPRAPLELTAATPPPPATTNSNVLLPSIRPRPLPTPTPPTRRKRARRVRLSGAGIGTASGDANIDAERSFLQNRPNTRLCHMGGIDSIISTVRELTIWPLFHSEVYSHLGVLPPRGILLHGPPGCGKTMLANALAGELGVSFLSISGPEIVSSMSGESERKLRTLFNEARSKAPSIIFIDEIDVIAARKEGASKDMERRIVSQLISCIDQSAVSNENNSSNNNDGASSQTLVVQNAVVEEDTGNYAAQLNEAIGMDDGGNVEHEMKNLEADMDTEEGNTEGGKGGMDDSQNLNGGVEIVENEEKKNTNNINIMSAPFIVIAATNRPESIEPALRRAGRFDREIELGAPDESARIAILKKLCSKLNLADKIDFEMLGKRTAGCVGADLDSLVREAAMATIRRFSTMKQNRKSHTEQKELTVPKPFTSTELVDCCITMQDLTVALGTIQPSALREGFAIRPDVTWKDIGALENVRKELSMAIVEPVKNRALFDKLGLSAPAGVLLYGPPGCGKTLLARAIAAESGANFISVKGPELLSKYVGDSELAIRKVFTRAKSSAPSIIFFDELDALAPRRGRDGGTSSGATERVVNMLLTEMDGFGRRRDVFLVAATNRPDIIDPAMLRPGRLDKLLYIGLPTPSDRVSILHKLAGKMLIDDCVDLGTVAKDKRCAGFSGADLSALLRCAGEQALRAQIENNNVSSEMRGIGRSDFEHALNSVLPSVSMRDAKLYSSMESKLRKSRAHLAAKEEESEKKDEKTTTRS